MLPHSAGFAAAVSAPFAKVHSRLDLVRPDGTVRFVLEAVDGTVTWSRQSGAIVAQLDVHAVDRTDNYDLDETTTIRQAYYGSDGDTYGGMGGIYGVYSQTIQTGALMPYGSEVRVYRGFRVAGQPELVLVGTFQLYDMQWDGDRAISLTLRDRSQLVQDHIYGFEPVSIAPGTPYEAAIDRVFQSGLNDYWRPRIGRSIAPTGEVTPKLDLGTSPGGNRWADVSSMARVCRQYAYFNRHGNLVVAPAADPMTATAAWTLKDGPGGTLVSVSRKILKSETFNGVIVTGSNSSSKDRVRGEARDDADPASPTYWQGPFGYKARTVSTPLVSTSAMAQNLANAIFVDQQGMHEQVDVTFLPHPALEITDIVHVDYSVLGMDYRYRIDRLSLPLGAQGLETATLKRRKSTDEY